MHTDSREYFGFDNLASSELAQRIQTASEEYRQKLRAKVTALRATLSRAETSDPRIQAFVETLDKIARNRS